MSLKQRLQAELGLEESDFETHESDLYVLAKPGVLEWLKKNHEFFENVRPFTGAAGSAWAGEYAFDIPFANQEFWDAKQRTLP